MKSLFNFTACLLLAASVGLSASAQEQADKARIVILKIEDGNTEEIRKEIEIRGESDLEELLEELGIFREFDELKSGETIEIDVRRYQNGDWKQQLEFQFNGEQSGKAFLGVMLGENEASPGTGIVITEIIENTSADASELQPGDVILEADKQEITGVEQFVRIIRNKKAGEKLDLRYERDGKKKKTSIVLGEKRSDSRKMFRDKVMLDKERAYRFEEFMFPDAPGLDVRPGQIPDSFEQGDRAYLGISPSTEQTEGMVIGKVYEGSAAEKMGLMSGDRVVRINDTGIDNFDALAEMIGSMNAGDAVKVDVIRGEDTMTLEGELGKRSGGERNGVQFFRDFKGMNEEGDFIYDFEFNLDETELEDQQLKLEELMLQLDEMEQRINAVDSTEIIIELDNVSREEAERVNANAREEFSTSNDLKMDNFSFWSSPGSNTFHLAFDLPEKGKLNVLIYDRNGKLISSEIQDEFSGTYSRSFNLIDVVDGIYFLQIIQNGKSYSKKLIKTN